MSRIGKEIIDIPSDVTVTFDGSYVTIKGLKDELERILNERITFKQEENTVEVIRPSDSEEDRTDHDTTRVLLNNMVLNASRGYEKTLEFVGIGYRVQMQSKDLVFNAGYSHSAGTKAERGITFVIEKSTTAKVSSVSKEQVGAIASSTYFVRPPEPYKGKGVRYQSEYVRRKEGKAGK